jgi:hypothetical protein
MSIDEESSTPRAAVAAADLAEPPAQDAESDGSGASSTSEVGGAGGGERESDERAGRSARAAAIVFAVYVVVAFFVLLYVGRDYWFKGDDWGLLAGRSLSVDDVFRPQNSHWSTVPILTYRVLYRIFGLHSYLPYMAVVIILRLGVAVLIRVIMRRAGVGPWVATLVAGTFVLFGAGHQNYFLSIQISMMASMVCGFGHLLLADHDGPFDKRDALGLAVGVVGLMASGVALPLTVVVGLAVLIRRGWLMAFLHTAPLAAIYGVWWLVYRPDRGGANAIDFGFPPFSVIREWVSYGFSGVFLAIGDFGIVAIALGLMLGVGLYLAWRPLTWGALRRFASMPVAMMLGALLLFVMVCSQRWGLGHQFARSSRYVDIAAALILPALAVAAYAFVRRWRVAGSLVLVLFLIGVPANLSAFGADPVRARSFEAEREFILGVAYSDLAQQVSPDVYPNPHQLQSDRVTVGFLRDALRDGKLPDLPPLRARTLAEITNRLSLSQSAPDDGLLSSDFTCEFKDEPMTVQAREGDQFGLRSNVQIAVETDGERAKPSTFGPGWSGDLLTVQVPEVTLHFEAAPPDVRYRFCTPR